MEVTLGLAPARTIVITSWTAWRILRSWTGAVRRRGVQREAFTNFCKCRGRGIGCGGVLGDVGETAAGDVD